MNIVMKKDFWGMATLNGRMHIEAYLHMKYLQHIKMLLYH